jgi:hypothetical protein
MGESGGSAKKREVGGGLGDPGIPSKVVILYNELVNASGVIVDAGGAGGGVTSNCV